MKQKTHRQEGEKRKRTRVALYARDDVQANLLDRFVERKRSLGEDWIIAQRFVGGQQ
jgi:hypothetical protein